jgi:hypothetical protein
MCWLKKNLPTTIEGIISQKSANMNLAEKSSYAYDIEKIITEYLLKINVPLIDIGGWYGWKGVATAQYPTLADVRIPDATYKTTTLWGLQSILTLDWTNKVPYLADLFDCDAFANMLYIHLRKDYKINSVFPVWGQTSSGYHGFNCAVIQNGDELIARLIEPQTDDIFIENGPLGKYSPDKTAEFLAVMPIQSPALNIRRVK